LSSSEVDAIVSTATHRRFPAPSIVVHQEDPAERFFLLTSGQGRHFVMTKKGERVLLHWLSAGQIFGGTTVLSSASRYLASAEVLKNSCALVWERKNIRELLSSVPKLMDNLLSIAVSEHIAWLLAAKISLSLDDAQGRIAHVLVSLSCATGEAGRDGIQINVANEDLAAAANVTIFTVSRSLRAWQRQGVLTKGRGKILLRRPEILLTSR
jgi:CRP-like cAMP-binding protein